MSIELLNKINDRYQTAISFHKEQADLFWYLYLPGFAMLHEYQHLTEALIQRKLKRYITSTYNKVHPDKIPDDINIIEPLTKGKLRTELTPNQRWTGVKESFNAYRSWEENTLKELENIASELLLQSYISTFNFIGEIIKEVKAELVFLCDIIVEMQGHDYDIPQITEMQSNMFERYEYLIKNIFGKSKKFHHYNSALDANARIFF